MVVETLMIGIMIYQVTMPDVKNGKYQIVYDGENIVRMNTQDGSMERCDKNLKCIKVEDVEKRK